MPFLRNINVSAVSGNTPEQKIDSVVKQLNDWAGEISNEKLASVQTDEQGNFRIVSGAQNIDGTAVIGTVYYDTSNVPRILIGLSPDDGRPGVWISDEGESVITLLT